MGSVSEPWFLGREAHRIGAAAPQCSAVVHDDDFGTIVEFVYPDGERAYGVSAPRPQPVPKQRAAGQRRRWWQRRR